MAKLLVKLLTHGVDIAAGIDKRGHTREVGVEVQRKIVSGQPMGDQTSRLRGAKRCGNGEHVRLSEPAVPVSAASSPVEWRYLRTPESRQPASHRNHAAHQKTCGPNPKDDTASASHNAGSQSREAARDCGRSKRAGPWGEVPCLCEVPTSAASPSDREVEGSGPCCECPCGTCRRSIGRAPR